MTTSDTMPPTPEGEGEGLVVPKGSPDATVVAVAVTTTTPEEQADQIAGALGRNWGVLLGLGIILAGLGVAVMVWPEVTIGIIAILLGIALLISGLFSVIAAFTRGDQPTGVRVLGGLFGAVSIILGGIALSGMTEAVWILALMIGFGWIVRGISDLALGIGSQGKRGRGLTITAGIIGIIAGTVVLVWPSITLLALAYISGIWLILLGVLQVVLAFRVRKVATADDLRDVVAA